MNVLYVLGQGSLWENNELRYSLRSIDLHAKNLRKVFLCGHKPDFIAGNVGFEKCADLHDSAAKNIIAKIDRAIECFGSDLGDEFLLSSDDHFYIKDVDFDNYPYFKKGELPSTVSSGIYGDKNYTQCLVNTFNMLKSLGKPTANYAQHCNSHINVKLWKRCRKHFLAALNLDQGIEPIAFTYNFLKGKKFILRNDCKVGRFQNRAHLLQIIKDCDCFSVYNSALGGGVADYLVQTFKNPSIYEK